MAFSNSVVTRFTDGGECVEIGTWTLTGGTTSGTITPALTGQGISGGINYIVDWSFSNDNNHAVIPNVNGVRTAITITSTALDTGKYTLRGRMA